MTDYLVQPAVTPLSGTAFLPSDKSISHRAIMFAAIADGASHIDRFSFGGDNVSTARCFQAMGIEIEESAGALTVRGRGLWGLREPSTDLDCGNSGTTMRLLAGLLAGQRFPFRMVGDESLSKRPMRRVLDPLASRGATLSGTVNGKDICAPLVSKGRLADDPRLRALKMDLKTSSAQVKSALLLSGLYASGSTDLSEPTVSRDHTERLMGALGVPLTIGERIKLDVDKWNGALSPFNIAIPGDLSAAAFLLAAAVTVPGSSLTLEGVGVNPTRAGVLDWLESAGFMIDYADKADKNGEPTATLTIEHGRGTAAKLEHISHCCIHRGKNRSCNDTEKRPSSQAGLELIPLFIRIFFSIACFTATRLLNAN